VTTDDRTRAARREQVDAFFAGLEARSPEPLLHDATGTLRFDVTRGSRTVRRTVSLSRGRIALARVGGAPDTVVTVAEEMLGRLVGGEANATAAVLRGELRVRGDIGLLLSFQRIFPGPPDKGRGSAKAG
jgi:hypothetical protein